MRKPDFPKLVIPAVIVISLTLLFPEEAVGCPFPSRFEHGTTIYENERDRQLYEEAPKNYILEFRCDNGYQLHGSKFIFCVAGNWTDVFPQCIDIHCGTPPSIDNGIFSVVKENNKHAFIGSTVKYSCLKGFELENETVNSLTCRLNGTSAVWAGELPKCEETDVCPDPGKSPSGRREGNCCFKGDILRFYCDDEHEIAGPQEIECLSGGSWSAPRPRCRPSGTVCSDPPDLSNGIIESDRKGDFFTPGSEVIIVCNEGYTIRYGSDQLHCENNGAWDNVFGRCEVVSCQYPEIPSHGSIPELKNRNKSTFPYGFHVTYECDEGFRLIGARWNTCNKGRWTFATPKCKIIKCYDPGAPEGGQRRGNNFEVGSKVSYSCFSGYTLLGSAERYCLKNGQWSGELTRCDTDSNHCPDPGTPINGMKTGSRYDKGEVVTYTCNPGFFLVGSDTRVCQPNRSWTGVEPKCIGPYDFDNRVDISDRLKRILQEKKKFQENELEIYRNSLLKLTTRTNFSSLEELEMAVTRAKILDLNFPGRILLYFLFDASGSIGEANFHTSIEFAKAFVRKVGISAAGARAGSISYSSEVRVQFLPVEVENTEEVIEKLDRIEYPSGGTATSVALSKLRTDVIPLVDSFLGRMTKHIVIHLTDGKYNTGGDPQVIAEELKSAGVEIFSIGVTGSLNTKSLYETASLPVEEHVFILQDYKALSYVIQDIINGTIDYSECGLGPERVSGRQSSHRIFGEIQAAEPWPWMAALFYMERFGIPQTELRCGGSVVGRQWILTAAHCVTTPREKVLREPETLMVKLGLTNLKDESHAIEFEASEFKIHERYDPETLDYDIALIKLTTSIDFNANIHPICLPPPDLPDDTSLYRYQESAYAFGWGYDRRTGSKERVRMKTVDHLKEIRLPIQSDERCRQSLKDTNYNFTDQMFCAGSGTGDVDTCAGDAGGPIMQSQLNEEGNVYWVQTGIVSWGIGCAQINQYGFYTHVQRLRNWIVQTMNTT